MVEKSQFIRCKGYENKVKRYVLRPALKCWDSEEGKHSLRNIIKVKVIVHPHPLMYFRPIDVTTFINYIKTSAMKKEHMSIFTWVRVQ